MSFENIPKCNRYQPVLLVLMLALYTGLCHAKDVYESLGTNVQLECSFTVNSGQSMTWAKVNGQDITYYSLNDKIQDTAPAQIKDRLTVSGNHAVGEYNLVISKTIISDGGVYECLNYQTANYFRQTLHIIDAPSSLLVQNKTPNNRLLGTEGQNLVVQCTAVGGDPVPDVTLHIPGLSAVPRGKQSVTYTLQTAERSWDGQTINCTASNNPNAPIQLTDFAVIYLNLKPFPPVFSHDHVNTEEAKPLVVSCTSDGSRPAAVFNWFLGDGNIDLTANSTQQTVHNTSTNTFVMTSTFVYRVDRRYNGKIIVCSVSNVATLSAVTSTKVLDVKYPADVNVENKTFQQSQTSRQLQCIIDGNPAVFTFDKWQHKSVYGVLIREFEGNSALILPNVHEDKRYQDTGQYMCTASNGILNSYGEIKQSGYGYVVSSDFVAMPVFTPDNKYMQYGEIGKSTDIQVNVYSVPKYTTQTWYKDNLTISKSAKFGVTDTPILVYDIFYATAVTLDGYRVTLSIDNLQEEDFTSYMVELSNGIGQSVNYTVVLAAHTDNHRSSSSGPLVGGVVGGFVVIVVIFSTVLLVYFKKIRGKPIPENQSSEKQVDNVGIDINFDDYEEVQNKGHQEQSKASEAMLLTVYETLDSRDRPNVYDELKKTETTSCKLTDEDYTPLGMKDQQNVYDELKKK